MGQLKFEQKNGELMTVEESPGHVGGDKAALKAALEAILFSMGDSIDPETVAQALEVGEEETRLVLEEMAEEYESPERGIRIIKLEGRYQLATKKEQYPALIRLVRQPRRISLSDVVLETLSIIAYKQPVTKSEIDGIRGIKCDRIIEGLMKKELIQELGRSTGIGRPILYGTTDTFLKNFGFTNLKELPEIEDIEAVLAMDESDYEMPPNLQVSLDDVENAEAGIFGYAEAADATAEEVNDSEVVPEGGNDEM